MPVYIKGKHLSEYLSKCHDTHLHECCCCVHTFLGVTFVSMRSTISVIMIIVHVYSTKLMLNVDSAIQLYSQLYMCLGVIIPSTMYFSLLCGMTIFGTVFSSLIITRPTFAQSDIIDIVKDSGPASTGLTFIWLEQSLILLLYTFICSILCSLLDVSMGFRKSSIHGADLLYSSADDI